jgi:hypothetical protein
MVYDLKLQQDGLVHPASLDNTYIGPNGASLLQEETTIPNDLVLLHEHGDHYSLQSVKPISIKGLQDLINAFIHNLPFHSKEEYFIKYPIPSY